MGFWTTFLVFYALMEYASANVFFYGTPPTVLFTSSIVLLLTGNTQPGDGSGLLFLISGSAVLAQTLVATVLAGLGTGALRFLAF